MNGENQPKRTEELNSKLKLVDSLGVNLSRIFFILSTHNSLHKGEKKEADTLIRKFSLAYKCTKMNQSTSNSVDHPGYLQLFLVPFF